MIAPTGVTLVIQVLVAVFVASVWLTLRRPDTLGVAWTNRMGFALLGWSAGAAAFTLHPRLITLREEVAWVQPTVIASAVLIALALQMSPDVRATFRRSATQPLLLQFVWRIVFGALLAYRRGEALLGPVDVPVPDPRRGSPS